MHGEGGDEEKEGEEGEGGGEGDHLDTAHQLNGSASNQCHSERLRGGIDAKVCRLTFKRFHIFSAICRSKFPKNRHRRCQKSAGIEILGPQPSQSDLIPDAFRKCSKWRR